MSVLLLMSQFIFFSICFCVTKCMCAYEHVRVHVCVITLMNGLSECEGLKKEGSNKLNEGIAKKRKGRGRREKRVRYAYAV